MTIEKLKEIEPLFGSWYVESKVAEGRNSKVFKVSRHEDGQNVYMCLKTVRFPRSNNEVSKAIASEKYATVDEYLSVLENAVRANMDKMLQLKDNGNIVRFEDYGIIKESSCFYVVMLMELLTPLSDYLKADKIRPKEVIKIGWDLCNALEGFRHEGIMHHNIKPDNIYVDGKGNYKLGDFGISDIGEENHEPGGYSAPELFSGAQVDSASDIYSLGVVLYKLLNNNRGPFLPAFPAPISLSDREQATVKRLRGDLFPTPNNADYNLSKIVFKATAFSPEDRYASPFLMRIDFEKYLRDLANAPVAVPTQNKAAAKAHHVSSEAPRKPRSDGARSVTDEDKNDFAEAFTDDETDEEERPDRKWLYIVMALAIVLALVIGLVVKSAVDRNKDSTTTEETTTTVITTTVPEPITTTEPTTQETTEETTTEETTTEETTTEETTQETTEATTEETTTEETTESTTNEEPSEPVLVDSVNTAGSQNEDGKYFINLENYAVLDGFDNVDDKQLTLEISDDLGPSPELGGDVYVYMMIGDVNIQTASPGVSLAEGDDGTYVCKITVYDEEFFYEPENYQYYLCFEEGAIESDTSVILPLQLKV